MKSHLDELLEKTDECAALILNFKVKYVRRDLLGPVRPVGHKTFLEVSALLDLRHCPKLQSCTISRKTNDVNLRKWQKP